jgi:RHS repeat-associated protein
VTDQTASAPAWQAKTYTYSETIPHAVTSLTTASETLGAYEYDANGNMTCRVEDGVTYKQEYNLENRISSIMKLRSGTCASSPLDIEAQWDFVYDGDGVRTVTAARTFDESGVETSALFTAYYTFALLSASFGGAYEASGTYVPNTFTFTPTASRKYFSFSGQTNVPRSGILRNEEGNIEYFLTDHLGSVVAITDDSGTLITQQRYLPFGGMRELSGYSTTGLTDYTYTGQRTLDPGMGGLMDYKARFYSPLLGRFTQPDTLIPDPLNPQAWNRFSYVANRPINFNDPTGHAMDDDMQGGGGSCDSECWQDKLKRDKEEETEENCTYHVGCNTTDPIESLMDGYMLGWENFGQAWNIYWNPNADFGERLLAFSYMSIWGQAHGMLIVGLAIAVTEYVAPGTIYCIMNSASCADKAINGLSRASEFGIQPYNQLRQAITRTGLQAHHIIEQRLARALGQTPSATRQWLSVAVTPEEHRAFTNLWRQSIGYINSGQAINTGSATPAQIWAFAQTIYAEHPALLEASRITIFGK